MSEQLVTLHPGVVPSRWTAYYKGIIYRFSCVHKYKPKIKEELLKKLMKDNSKHIHTDLLELIVGLGQDVLNNKANEQERQNEVQDGR